MYEDKTSGVSAAEGLDYSMIDQAFATMVEHPNMKIPPAGILPNIALSCIYDLFRSNLLKKEISIFMPRRS